jgi:hypothetical protein
MASTVPARAGHCHERVDHEVLRLPELWTFSVLAPNLPKRRALWSGIGGASPFLKGSCPMLGLSLPMAATTAVLLVGHHRRRRSKFSRRRNRIQPVLLLQARGWSISIPSGGRLSVDCWRPHSRSRWKCPTWRADISQFADDDVLHYARSLCDRTWRLQGKAMIGALQASGLCRLRCLPCLRA